MTFSIDVESWGCARKRKRPGNSAKAWLSQRHGSAALCAIVLLGRTVGLQAYHKCGAVLG